MDVLENPFWILGATTRDNRHRIMELTEEKCLLLGEDIISSASSALSNPRKRLTAEIAWLPGLGPKRATEAVSQVRNKPNEILGQDNIPALSRANLLAAGLKSIADEADKDELFKWIIKLAEVFDEIDQEAVLGLVNEEREISGFPPVTDQHALESEIDNRRQYYRSVIRDALNHLSPNNLIEVMTETVESATDMGVMPAPLLIDDLVDAYEVEAHTFLEEEEGNIKTLVEKLRRMVDAENSDPTLAPIADKLIKVVKNWDTVAQPIQVSTKSRGLGHDASHRVADMIRGLIIHIMNKHGKLDLSLKLTNMLQEVFAEVVEVAEQTAEDITALDEIAEQRIRQIEDAKTHAEEWRNEITYEAELGIIFKDKLSISPREIEWKGRKWNLDSITKLRWGGTKHSVNGIPTGTTYNILFGNKSDCSSIELKNETIYNNFIDRLWKTAGIQVLNQYLKGLRDGKKYRFGSTIMSDHGMELERKKIFSKNERVYCPWSELIIWNSPGVFCIGKKEDKKLAEAFSYLEEDNIHVFEALIRLFWKRGGEKLSSLLEE
jgi:hypothetical protein